MRNMKCLNCDIYGHSFQYCTKPIMSFGIIAYRYKFGKIEYLLIQRKDTIGYTDFLRGRYKKENLQSIIEEMTNYERNSLIHNDFDQLWDKLWHNHKRGIYINEKNRAKTKFNSINIKDIIEKIQDSKYTEPEYGFPKGRKNLHETYERCAKREFEEETGIKSIDYDIDDNIEPLVETFVGSDGNVYSHIYYIAKVNPYINIEKNDKSDIFLEEISNIVFLEFRDAYISIRDYDTQKKHTLYIANKILKKKLNTSASNAK